MSSSAATITPVTPGSLRALAQVMREVDVHRLPLQDWLLALRDLLRALAWLQLQLLRAASRAELWKSTSATSEADWYAQHTGRTTGAAQAELATGQVAERNPQLADALKRGRLSADQATEIASVADRATEQELDAMITTAEHDCFDQLKAVTGPVRARTTTAEQIRRAHDRRSVSVQPGPDGGLHLRATGPTEAVMGVNAVLDADAERLYREDRHSGRRWNGGQRRFDSLLARFGLPPVTEPPSPAPGPPVPKGPGPISSRPRSPRRDDGESGASPDRGVAPVTPQAALPGAPSTAADGAPAVGQLSLEVVDAPSPPVDNVGSRANSTLLASARSDTGPAGAFAAAPLATPAAKQLGVLRVEYATLARGWAEAGEVCDLNGLHALTVPALIAQARGAKLAVVVTDGDQVAGAAMFGSRFTRRAGDSGWLAGACRQPGLMVHPCSGLTHIVHVPAALLPLSPADSDTRLLAQVARRCSADELRSAGRHCNAAQTAVLDWRQPNCRVAGCRHTASTEDDHRIDWVRCHLTDVDYIDRLCPFHHRQKTFHGYQLVAGTGRRAFLRPDGTDRSAPHRDALGPGRTAGPVATAAPPSDQEGPAP